MAHRRGPNANRLGLALMAIVLVIDNIQADETCRSGCRGAPQTFKYVEGTTYKYNLDSKIVINLSSAETQDRTTEIKAQVLLTQQSECNQVIRLQNVQIVASDGKKHTRIPDVDKPIRINYHDGHLEDSLCITAGDTQNSLNLKRAVASLFQANQKSGHETDVFGLCPTDVTSFKEGASVIIQKQRNLNKCAYRESLKQDFLATAFNPNSEIKSSPILNSDYSAKLKIQNGILNLATVTENYLYVPFSVGNNGAKAKVETKLQFVSQAKENPTVKVTEPRSVIFEDPHPVNSPTSNVNSILSATQRAAKTIGLTVGEDTAKEFINLIKILRVSNKDDLLAVYNQVRAGVGFADKVAGKKLFLDALLRAGNGDTIEVAIELLKNRELNDCEQKLLYLGLPLVRHSSESSLNAAAGLLDQPNIPREAYLGISTLAGRYCRQHSCKNSNAITKLTQKLLQKLGDGKASNKNDETDKIFILKSLGNLNQLNDQVLAKIIAIAQDKSAPNRLRVSALESYLADPCKDKLRSSALGILKDIQQDSEVRIKAYLALAQCPNAEVGNAVKSLLDDEPSYQVGGFIVSHIRNLRSSANPDKELSRQYLGFINLPKKYPVDLRKWSQNGEFSYAVDSLGIANSIESNVIYSQDSFLPRSTSLNLTADVFGHTFNFLEVETRQENLDRLLEHYLGPEGVLRSSTPEELWNEKNKNAHTLLSNLKEKLFKSIRSRRDVSKSELDQIAKIVQIKTNALDQDLDLDLSLKLFGSELLFINVNDDVKKWTPEVIIDRIVADFNKGLDSLKNFDETLRANLMFLDGEFVYPTSTGFPLRLGVEGSANIQVKAKGQVDVRALLEQGTNLKLSLIPSANIEIAGRLTLDALLVEEGLKVITNLHTSTGGDLTVELTRNNIDVKFGLPLEKQDLISVNHDIVFHTRELGGAEKNSALKFAQNKDFSICLDQLSPIIGLTFCGDINGPYVSGQQVPALPFPLAGDAKVAIYIEKNDISQYHFKQVLWDESGKIGAEVSIAALDKNNQKKVSLEVEAFVRPQKRFKATLISPLKTATLEGILTETQQEQSALLRFVHDQAEYYGKIGVSVAGSPSKSVYKPILEYKTPQINGIQIPEYRVEGQVIVDRNGPNNKYTFDNVKIISPNSKAIIINGNVGSESDSVFSDLTVGDGTTSGSVKGRLQVNPQLVKLNVEVKNTFNPQANINIKGELSRNAEEVKGALQIIHGADLSSKVNILTLGSSSKYRLRSPTDFVLETKNKLTYPALGLDLKLDVEHDPSKLDYDVNVQYGDFKLGSELDTEWKRKPDGLDFDVELEVWGLGSRLEAKSKRTIVGDLSSIENSIEINGKKVEVTGKVKHHVKPQDVDVSADLNIKVPQNNVPFKLVAHVKANPSEIDLSEKVSSGATVYVDTFLKANKGGNVNGAIKITLKDQLLINGQIKATKGQGNGDITVDLPSIPRTSKAETTFTIQDPIFNVIVNIYPVFSEDKTKKIILSTQNRVTPNDLDTKNKLDLFGNTLEVNAKGSRSGDLSNGKINGEAEIILPNDVYLSGKINRDLKTVNDVIDGSALGTIEVRKNKNTPGGKFQYKGVAKATNFKEGKYDLNWWVSLDSGTGKDVNLDWSVRRQPTVGGATADLRGKLHGSVLPNPLEASLTGEVKDGRKVGQYQLTTNAGPGNALSAKINYDVAHEGRPCSAQLDLNVQSTSKVIKSVKLAASGSILKSDRLELSSSGNLLAVAPEGVLVDVDGRGELKAGDKEANVKGTLRVAKNAPVSIDLGYKRAGEIDKIQLQGHGVIDLGSGKTIKADLTLNQQSKTDLKADLKLQTPLEKLKNAHLQLATSISGETRKSDLTATIDGKTWTYNSVILLSESTPSLDIQAKCPEGKLSQIYFKVNKLSQDQQGFDVKVICQRHDFLLEGSVDADVPNIDNFHVKLALHCPKWKIDKLTVDAQNTAAAKTGRKIQVIAKSNGKNILAGSTSYTSRQEQGKLIIEGSGSFKVKEETQSANFKYIRQNLLQDKNGETGIEISFDGGLGNKAIDAELKVTNKQFRILNSYCEEKKQCAHIEIDAKTLSSDLNNFSQEIEVAVDLRNLGLSHEFGLKAVTNVKGYVLDHTVDVHFQSQENNKYQYSLYVHPRDAGVSLTTPKRVIALEGKTTLPQDLRQGGKGSAEVVFYLDKKNQPNQKTALIGWLNVDTKGYQVEGEVKFTNPALGRALSITGSQKINPQSRSYESIVNLDIFAQPSQKLTAILKQTYPELKLDQRQISSIYSFQVKSPGLGIDITEDASIVYNRDTNTGHARYSVKYNVGASKYLSILSLEGSPRQISSLVRVLNVDLVRSDTKLQLSSDSQVIDTDLAMYGCKPSALHLEVKKLNTLKWTVARKDTPNDKLVVSSALIPGQIADFRAEIYKGSAKNELLHATIKLDEANFLKSDYGVQSQNIQNLLLKPAKETIDNHLSSLKEVSGQFSDNLAKEFRQLEGIVSKSAPNLTPLKNYYQSELEKIKNEILADQTIKDISEFLQNIIQALAQAFGETFSNLSRLIESIAQALHQSFGKILEVIEKEIVPKLKEIADRLLDLGAQIVQNVTDVTITWLAKLSQILEKYQPELKQLGATLSEISQDVARVVVKAWDTVKSALIDYWNTIVNEIKALPIVEEIKASYRHFIETYLPNKEILTGTLRDLVSTAKDLIPLDEGKVLIDALGTYLEQKINGQPVDDIEALNRIGQALLATVRRIVAIITSEGTPDLNKINLSVPSNWLGRLPKWAAIRLSPLTYLLREDLPQISDFALSLVNHPRNLVPPFPLYALLAQGQHIFTFDGKHLTFPGTCNYLLARDALDGNFSVAGTYANGILTAISLSDGADVVTLRKGGQVLLNNAQVDLPARKPTLAAYRDYEKITLVSTAGVRVICGPELVVCSVTASGFYHGRLRGLLGNGNNEPYDDFTTANGKIVTNEGEFGNSYKLTSSCQPVKTVEHHTHKPAATCDKLFSWDSELRYCYPFVRNDNFKTACEHGVAAGVKDTERSVAVAYVAACNQHAIPVRVPQEFVQCQNGDKPTELGDKFSVKTPAKSADIVLLVDTTKANEVIYKELVTPLVVQLTNDLRTKGITDLEFHLVTYGGENKWPSHVTVGGKLTFKGKAPNVKFTDGLPEPIVASGCREMDQVVQALKALAQDLKLALGLDLQARTYDAGLSYPFRPNAVKSIIAVTSSPCETGRFYPIQILRSLLYRSKLIHLNLITPFEKLTVKDSKYAKDIVGFNVDNVALLGQKARAKGNSELHKELDYEDYCVDFTIENKGNVFVSDNFLNAKGPQRKQFVQIVSHTILDQVTRVELGLDCECKYSTPFSARNVCRVAKIDEKAPAKRTKG